MKNTENYFDTLPYNGKLIRNSNRPASNSIGPDEYIKDNPEPGPQPVDKYTHFYVEDVNGARNTLIVSGGFSDRTPQLQSYSFEVSEDGIVWTPYTIDINDVVIEVPYFNKIYIRSSVPAYCVPGKNKAEYMINITSAQPFNIGGNIMSLLYGKDFTGDETSFPQDSSSNVFSSLFWNDQNLRDASNLILPAETLLPYCYSYMFSESSITAPPKTLPATTLAYGCYQSMFYGCHSLTQSPEILATSFGNSLYCCVEMFRDSRINEMTIWINDKWDSSATQGWLADALPEGSFYNLGNVNIPRDLSGCPQGWTLYTSK